MAGEQVLHGEDGVGELGDEASEEELAVREIEVRIAVEQRKEACAIDEGCASAASDAPRPQTRRYTAEPTECRARPGFCSAKWNDASSSAAKT